MAQLYRRQEATVAADETDNPIYNNISASRSDNSTTGSWHSTTSSSFSSIRFGNVNVREYERQLDPNADVDLGLTLGWRYIEHQPQHLDTYMHQDDNNNDNTGRSAFLDGETTTNRTTETERAEILLASGYSKRQLRLALHKQHKSDLNFPPTLQSRPGTMARSMKRRVKGIVNKLY